MRWANSFNLPAWWLVAWAICTSITPPQVAAQSHEGAANVAQVVCTNHPMNPQKRWFKGNLHTHSLWSDGDDFPEMIVDWYRERGYSFLALSDHNILSEGEKWVTLAEVEKRGGNQVFPKYQAPPMFGLATDDSHNYHGKTRAVPGRGWIQVRAESLSIPAILNAMRAGDFYASTGVEFTKLEFDPQQRRLALEIVPNGDAQFTTRFIGTRKNFDPTTTPRINPETGKVVPGVLDYSNDVGQVLATVVGLKAEYQFSGDELYVRAEVTRSQAPEFPTTESPFQKAWTQPFGWSVTPAGEKRPQLGKS